MESEVGKARELSLMLSPKKVYGMIGGVLAVQILSFYLFLKNIEPRFIYTFYSTMTGNEQSFLHFHNHSDDALKLEIFGENKHKWKKIREEVVEWVNLKILEWNEEQPEWWDAQRKAMIPDWAVRDGELLKTVRSSDVVIFQGRRSSIGLSEVGGEEGGGAGLTWGAKRRRTVAIEARRELSWIYE